MISDQSHAGTARSSELLALLRDLLRAVAVLLAVGIVVLYLAYYTMLVRHMYVDLHMNDFGKFYYSARAFLESADMYAANPATDIRLPDQTALPLLNMNPPHFHLLVLPLAALTPIPALIIWSIVSLAALIASLRIIARELALTWTLKRVLWTIAGVILCSATGTIIVTGQITFLLMLPIALAWVAARHGHFNRAAVYFGVAASIKPFLAIFGLYLLIKRHLKAAGIMVLAAALSAAIGIAIFGWNEYGNWLNAVSAVSWTWLPMNGSLAGLFSRGFSDTPFFSPLILAPNVVRNATTVAVLAVASLCFISIVRDKSEDAVDRAFANFLLTAQLVSPLGWVYYLWLIAGPAAALMLTRHERIARMRDTLLLISIVGLLWPLHLTTVAREHPWSGITLGSVYTWTTLLLWVAVMVDWRAARRVVYGFNGRDSAASTTVRSAPKS